MSKKWNKKKKSKSQKSKKNTGDKKFFLICLSILLIVILSYKGSTYLVKNWNDKEVKEPTADLVEAPLTYIPQYVVISFDGSKSVDMWRKIRGLKTELKNNGKELNVTHFINAAYFLTPENKYMYKGPGKYAGTSDIGFTDGIGDIKERIEEVNLAIDGGDEIGSHTVGHFSGRAWTKEQWTEEFISFDNIMFNLDKLYLNNNLPKLNFKKEDMVGFRAPYLDKSWGLYEALPEYKFKYDTSEIGTNNLVWPYKDAKGLWHIPMGLVKINGSNILAMDYNIWMYDSGGENHTLKKGTPEWEIVYNRTLKSFLNYFDQNYTSTRAPVLIGYHFQEWNDGVYWEALKEFSREVCGLPEVKCDTFKELVEYMEEYGVPKND